MRKIPTVVTTRELGKHMLETGTILVPIYQKRDNRDFIVPSRNIWDRKPMRKAKIKL